MAAPDTMQASQVLVTAEIAALTQIQEAIDTLYTTLDGINSGLQLAAGYRSDAKRIIGDIEATLQFRKDTEISQLIEGLSPPTPAE